MQLQKKQGSDDSKGNGLVARGAATKLSIMPSNVTAA